MDIKRVCFVPSIEEVLAERKLSDYDIPTQRVISLLTTSPSILPVGSAKFKVHAYPSDLDLFERFEDCCTVNEVRFKLRRRLQDIVRNISCFSDIFLGDFKAGYDRRFNLYLGDIVDGSIVDYSPSLIRRDLTNLRYQGALPEEKYYELMNLVKEKPSLEDFQQLSTEIRNLYVLRWTPEEILQGYKFLPPNGRIWLEDALIDKSVVKIDVWAPLPYSDISSQCYEGPVPGRYVEITNWFLVVFVTPKGDEKVLSEDLKDYATSLQKDIEKYLSPDHLNLLKAAKRLWSLLLFARKKASSHILESECSSERFRGFIQLDFIDSVLIRLAPLFSSYIALLNSLRSDLDLLFKLEERVRSGSLSTIHPNFFDETIEGIRLRLLCFESDPPLLFPTTPRTGKETNICVSGLYFDPCFNKFLLEALHRPDPSLLSILSEHVNSLTSQYLYDNDLSIDSIVTSLKLS